MSLQSELQYLLSNWNLPSGDSIRYALEGTITGPGVQGWGGVIAVSGNGLFLSSEPGFVSDGAAIGAAWGDVAVIERRGSTIRVSLRHSTGQLQGFTVVAADGHSDEVLSQANAMVDYVRFCRANVIATLLGPELDRILSNSPPARATQELLELSGRDPASAVPLLWAALMLGDEQRFDEAVQAAEGAVARGIEQVAVLPLMRALRHRALGELAEAEREAQRALSESEDEQEMFPLASRNYLRGQALEVIIDAQVANDRWSLALQTCDALEQTRPGDASVMDYRIRIALATGNERLAEDSIRAYGLDPNHDVAAIQFYQGFLDWVRGRKEDAIRKARASLAAQPSALVARHLMEWLGPLKEWKEVVALCDHVFALEGRQAAEVLLHKAGALLELGSHQDALANADAALVAGASAGPAHGYLCSLSRAAALNGLSRYDEALATALELRQQFARDREAIFEGNRQAEYLIAYVHATSLCGLSRFEEARPWLRQAARLPAPGFTQELREVERLEELARQHDEAERAIRSVRPPQQVQAEGQALFGKRNETLRRLRILHEKLAVDSRLKEHAEEVHRLRAEYEQPPVIAVLGEFNAGKSTFINALLGADLLPTDVVPTTATINVLKYADSPSARILWADGSVEDISIERLREYVVEQRSAAANEVIRRIRHVEIGQPHPVLKRISLVDTPGLNALIPEHREVTHDFLRKADAVVWLFRADQAGKDSELESVLFAAQFASKTIGVLNQKDRVPALELPELLEDTRTAFASVMSHVVAVSSRKALEASLKGDPRGRDASGLPGFERLLNDVVLSQAKQIKESGTVQKAVSVIRRVETLASAAKDECARLLESTGSLKARIATFKTDMHRYIADREQHLSDKLGAASAVAAGQLCQLMHRHITSVPTVDVRYVSEGILRAMLPVFRQVADDLDQRTREQLDELRAGLRMLEDSLERSAGARLFASLEVEVRARLRENDMLINLVSEYLRGRLDAGDLWGAILEVGEASASSVTSAHMTGVLCSRYAFVPTEAASKCRGWADDLYASMLDIVEHLEEEIREHDASEREDVFKPVVRMIPQFGLEVAAE